MKFKEKAIIVLNEVIYSKKSKLGKEDRDNLIVLREVIRGQKKKGLLQSAKEIAKMCGLPLGDDDEFD